MSPVFTDVQVMLSGGDAGPGGMLFPPIGYGQIGSGVSIDSDGYRSVAMGMQTWTLSWTGSNGTSSTPIGFFTSTDTVWTVFFYGRSTTSLDTLNQAQLYICKDSSTAQPMSPCGPLILPPPH
jgi:hypothetical protein